MAAIQWKDTYRGVIDGQQVRAGITNQAASDLFNNLMYLKSLFDSSTAGRALVIYDQVVGATTVVGTSVYRDSNMVWQPAISELVSEDNSTLFELSDRAQVSGMVVAKNSALRGDIAVFGEVVTDDSILDVIDGTYVSGAIYYLSPTVAGNITASRGVAPVKVCIISGPDSSGNYRILVTPEQRVRVDGHTHVRLTLDDSPAGDANCVPGKDAEIVWGDLEPDGPYPGVVHVVENADSSLIGWLPADDPAFDGMAVPSGAKFGYNIAADADVLQYWPPLPLEGVDITVDGISVIDDKIIINTDGIWWMDDTYGHAPWPVNLPCGSSSASSSLYPIWPLRIELWFTRMLSSTTETAVNNQAMMAIGVHEGLNPVAVGDNIDTVITDEGVPVLQLKTGGTGSSALPGGLSPNVVVYRMVGRDFLNAGRTVEFPIELILGADASLTTIGDTIDGLTLSVTRVPAATAGSVKDASTDITTEELSWTTIPDDTTVVPDGKYYRIRSSAVEVSSGEVLILALIWDPSVLGALGDTVNVYAVRPATEW